jgi:hypothetical protein
VTGNIARYQFKFTLFTLLVLAAAFSSSGGSEGTACHLTYISSLQELDIIAQINCHCTVHLQASYQSLNVVSFANIQSRLVHSHSSTYTLTMELLRYVYVSDANNGHGKDHKFKRIDIHISALIKFRGLSPQANYTDQATAACRRS